MPNGHEESISQALARAIQHRSQPVHGDAVRHKVRLCLMDFLSCALEARTLPWASQAQALADPPGDCTIIGTPRRAAPADAAFANAVAGHGLVREDMHALSISHLGVVVLPALLAVAEQHGLSGAAFAEAAILGYEIGARIGAAIVTPEFTQMFRPTGFTGPIAVAAALCNLLDMEEEQCVAALAFAANMVGGLNQWPYAGTDEMFFHPGHAALCGIRAVKLAMSGAQGSMYALDGVSGLLRAYRPDRQANGVKVFEDGFPPEIMSVYFKSLPVCNFAQTPCQAALALSQQPDIDPSRIRSIRVRVTQAAHRYPGCSHSGPFKRTLQAKMSIPYAVAAALVHREVTEASYAYLTDSELNRLASAVELMSDPNLTAAYPAAQGAMVTVVLDDGTEISRSLADVEPADDTLIQQRFRAAATDALGPAVAHEIQSCIDGLEDFPDIGALMRLLTLTQAA